MSECTICNVCQSPGTYEQCREEGKVYSHVACFKDDAFTVWRCSNCGSLHSKESVDLGRYYAAYPFKNHTLDFHTRHGYTNRIKMLKRSGLKPHHSVLDFGCGAGLFVQFLRDNGFPNAVGFDPFIPHYAHNDVLGKKFDFVVSYDVIEHVEDPKDFFAQMIQLSKSQGVVVIGTPNASELKLEREGANDTIELSQPYHRHILSEQVLFDLAQEHNFSVEDIHRRFYFDTWFPLVNTRFMWSYIKARGGMIDVAVEPLKISTVLRSPRLWFYALFGYLFRVPGNILLTLRNRNSVESIRRVDCEIAA